MLSWDLRCPNNCNAEIIRIVLFVALLTRHGTVPGTLGRMEPGIKSQKTKLCDKPQANVAVWARNAHGFPAAGSQTALPGGTPFHWLKHQHLPLGRVQMTYCDHCKLDVNPMDTKGPRMYSESSLQSLREEM